MTDLIVILLFLGSGSALTMYGYSSLRQQKRLQNILSPRVDYRFHHSKNQPREVLRSAATRLKPIAKNWLLLSQAAAFGAAVTAGILFFQKNLPWAAGFGSLAISLFLFTLFISHHRKKKKQQLINQLPEAIEVIVRGARVGLTIEHSFKTIGEEMSAPIGPEFRSMAEKLHLGQELQAVVKSTAARIEAKEFVFLAVTLIVQQQSGGQYSNILQNLGQVLRTRKAQEQKLYALTSEARLSAKAIAFITAGLLALIALTNEAQIDFLVNEATGRGLLLYSAASIAIGFILISILLRTVSR